MAEIRVTQEEWLGIETNANASIRETQEEYLAIETNANANATASQVVWLAIVSTNPVSGDCFKLLSCP